MTSVECSLCGMIFTKEDPEMFIKQTIRHTQWHDPKYKGTSRDSAYYKQINAYKKRNTVMGVPVYVAVVKE